jgi:cytochrome c peroxidase
MLKYNRCLSLVVLGGYVSLCVAAALAGADYAFGQAPQQPPPSYELGIPFHVPPSDNPTTPAKINLGRELFFDKRLSRDNTVSCATCHDPNYGFSDPHPVSIGVEGRKGERSSMTLLNIAHIEPLMWDGRSVSLEDQSLLPFAASAEFDLPVEDAIVKLRRQGYSSKFEKVFGTDISAENLARALAAYQRSLNAGDSPFDRFLFLKDTGAISDAAKRGFEVFLRVKCDSCHLIMTPGLHPFALRHVMFTDNKYHNIGVGADLKEPDPGRYVITRDEADWGSFRTPTLRNVALTEPYFHDGSARTLLDVVEFYDLGGKPNPNLDEAIIPLKLKPEEKLDLVAFLKSLTSSRAAELGREESSARPAPEEEDRLR